MILIIKWDKTQKSEFTHKKIKMQLWRKESLWTWMMKLWMEIIKGIFEKLTSKFASGSKSERSINACCLQFTGQ